MSLESKLLFVCLLMAGACVAQAQTDGVRLPWPSPEAQIANDAATAALDHVNRHTVVESNTAVSDRVRAIAVNDRGRRCVIEVHYTGSSKNKDLPSGWLISKDGCRARQ